MTESRFCPVCGAGLPGDAPGGLCPRCLKEAALCDSLDDATVSGPGTGAAEPIRGPRDQEVTVQAPPTVGAGAVQPTEAWPARSPDVEEFRHAVLELGLIRPEEFDQIAAGSAGSVPDMARALVRAGKLTPYQAGAITQGKTRGRIIGALIDLERDAFSGSWQMKDSALATPTTPRSRLQIPYVPPPEYTIDTVVERQGEGIALILGFRAGEQPVVLAVDAGTRTESVTGLEGVDGIPVRSNQTAYHGRLLLPSRPARLSLIVRRGAVTFTCDGKTIVAWRGDPKRLIRLNRWELPDKRKLFLGSSASFLVRSMKLTPLK